MAKQKKDYVVSTPEVARRRIREEDIMQICRAWEQYDGPSEVFESAIGSLIVGRLIGSNGLRVIHNWRTLRKYEEILGRPDGHFTFKDALDPTTDESERLNGIRYAKKFAAFWKALAGGVSSEPGAKVVDA